MEINKLIEVPRWHMLTHVHAVKLGIALRLRIEINNQNGT